MRQTITFIAIAIVATTISCNKNDKYKIKDSTVVVNPPNTNPGVTTPTTTPTNPTDLNLKGTINSIQWIDKGAFNVSNSAQLALTWDQLAAPYSDVNVEINLYDEATHADRLMPTISVVVKSNSYSTSIPTNKVTPSCPGWLTVTVVPLQGSGKKAVTLTANFN